MAKAKSRNKPQNGAAAASDEQLRQAAVESLMPDTAPHYAIGAPDFEGVEKARADLKSMLAGERGTLTLAIGPEPEKGRYTPRRIDIKLGHEQARGWAGLLAALDAQQATLGSGRRVVNLADVARWIGEKAAQAAD